MKILNQIQQKLHVPKQANQSVKYKSRSAEDIIEMVKPLLGEAVLTLTDEMVLIGERYYIKATATIVDEVESVSATAYAREDEKPQFMSVAQGTGSTSSYARKYALNGLLLIDDTKDDDTREYVAPKVKTLSVYEQVESAINNVKNLTELETITKRIQSSKAFTEEEKEELINHATFKSEELK